ncbi:hypothetical protein [Bdellovibrio sp. HCB2-146]|uniref:hypothetical protein n=1 Tax=Bdellovibrio sp. HCB2-146 TaxID=3394362 RepID=UPI0039BC39CF
MRQLKIAGALILSLGLASCTHKKVVSEAADSREPAAAGISITPSQEKILAEMISGDSPIKPYRHSMQVRFYTNNDKKYLTETTKKALQEALFKSLGSDTSEQGLGKIVAGNLKDAILDNFVKTLRVYKIVNTSLQVDLVFAPTPNKAGDFTTEFASNQLVNLDEVGSLTSKWDQLEKATTTDSVYKYSTLVPDTGRNASYIGGVATIFIEILDANPKLRLPLPLKNGVKGFVRYRRYYRVPQDLSSEMVCGNFTLKAAKAGAGVPLFYTVDLYKNFNLKNLIPTAETVEVYPGLIATTNVGRQELLPRGTEGIGKSIPTASVIVSQKKGLGGDVSFSLQKLVYKAEDRVLNYGDSEVDIVKRTGRSFGPAEDSTLANQAKINFLKQCEKPLSKLLNLDFVLPGGSL